VDIHPFLNIGKFSAIMLLNELSIPIVCISSSIPVICRFGLSMVSQRAYMLHLCFLSMFFIVFNLIPLLYFQSLLQFIFNMLHSVSKTLD
jgi:hypothetical protein